MTQPDEPNPSPTLLLSLAEAASRLGLHPSALRSRIRRGAVTAKRGNAGQLLIEVPANARPPSDEAAASPSSPEGELGLEIDQLRRELEATRLAVAKADGERDVAVARLTAERAAATATAAAKVDAAERIIAELRAELARLRLPFWRRWLG
jgi:hypothetical protein